MSGAAVRIHIDGAARGNPGPAAFAFIIRRDGQPAEEHKETLGTKTNNYAEYTALVKALERAADRGDRELHIYSDSELLVKQMNGEYKVKNPDLKELYDEASILRRKFKSVKLEHIPRARNSDADRLCNEALDGGSGKRPAAPRPRSSPAAPGAATRSDRARAEALECLRSAAAAWARGQANDPPPEFVWDQLWSILEEHQLVTVSRPG